MASPLPPFSRTLKIAIVKKGGSRSHPPLLPTAYLDLAETDRGSPGVRKPSAAQIGHYTPPAVSRPPEQLGLSNLT